MTGRGPPAHGDLIGRAVLVGVDGSAESADAVALARRIAESAAGRLHLVAAAPDLAVEVAAVRARLPLEKVRERLLAKAADRAIEGLEGVLDRNAARDALTVRRGRPEHVLTVVAREVAADLLVLGGRRHRAPASWLERGTAHHLLRSGERPLIVTGPNATRIRRVLAAVDLSPATEPTLALARRLAALLELPLQALHVASRPDLPDGMAMDLDFDVAPGELVRTAERELEATVGPSVPVEVRSGDVVASLRSAAEADPFPLLVVGSQGHGWVDRLLLGSTTEALLAALPCTLAIAPFRPESSD